MEDGKELMCKKALHIVQKGQILILLVKIHSLGIQSILLTRSEQKHFPEILCTKAANGSTLDKVGVVRTASVSILVEVTPVVVVSVAVFA